MFQLTRVSTDEEDDKKKRHLEMFDSEMAVINAIDVFKNVLLMYNDNISDNTLAVVGMVAENMYKRFGFLNDVDDNGVITKAKYPTFENLKNTDFPTLSDFANSLLDIMNEFNEMGKLNLQNHAQICY